jgi:hypothetical protein
VKIQRDSPEDYARTFGYVAREAKAIYALDAAITLRERRRQLL